MMLAADELMYDVKRAGKNSYRLVSREPGKADAEIAGER
jgi:hypothetical protein